MFEVDRESLKTEVRIAGCDELLVRNVIVEVKKIVQEDRPEANAFA